MSGIAHVVSDESPGRAARRSKTGARHDVGVQHVFHFHRRGAAEREALLRRAREAGLPPREYELFRLVMGDQRRFLRNGKLNHREAAQEMHVAVGTIKSLWSRIKKTLAA